MRKTVVGWAFVFIMGMSSAVGAELTSEVRILNGMPALYVNGKLASRMLASPFRPGSNGRTPRPSGSMRPGISGRAACPSRTCRL